VIALTIPGRDYRPFLISTELRLLVRISISRDCIGLTETRI